MRSLVLSGGGFRAALYHLGVIRCLAEEGKLADVKAIYSVSGGSILAAHLVLHWQTYCNPETFRKAADPFIAFMQRDVRGNVFTSWFWRRFGMLLLTPAALAWAFVFPVFFIWFIVAGLGLPMAAWTWARTCTWLGWSNIFRRCLWLWLAISLLSIVAVALGFVFPVHCAWLIGPGLVLLVAVLACAWGSWLRGRTTLLVAEYEKGLYGETDSNGKLVKEPTLLSKLAPTVGNARPRLFILSTNLNTGDLCGFAHDGFHWWSEQGKKGPFGPGNITIAEAVAASSAFPPAFPPFALDRKRLGQDSPNNLPKVTLLTDGGVYDNSGIEGFIRHCNDCPEHQAGDLLGSSAERAMDHLEGGLGWYRLLAYRAVRASDIVMGRVAKYQLQDVARSNIPWAGMRLVEPLPSERLRADVQLLVRTIRTDLNSFSRAEAQLLVYYGYVSARRSLFAQDGLEAIGLDPRTAAQHGYEESDQGVLIRRLPTLLRKDCAGLMPGMVIAQIDDKPVNASSQYKELLRTLSVRGGKLEVRGPRGGAQPGGNPVIMSLAPDVAGIELTTKGMPYVAPSAGSTRWLPFSGDANMHEIDPEVSLKNSHSVRLFSTTGRLFGGWLLLLVILVGSAFAHLYAAPTSLSFASVFTAPTDPFEKTILEEIERNELASKYKRALTPEHSEPAQRLFYGFTKPLGEYCAGRAPGEFHCRIKCDVQEYKLEAWLFLRSEVKGKPAYQMLSSPNKGEFTISASRAGDRIVAIGRVVLPKEGPLGDLKQLIRLEVVE